MSEHLEQLLLTLWERARRAEARHRRLVDVAIALAVAALSIVGLAAQHRLGHTDLLVFCACLCTPMLLHRRSPMQAFALIAAVCFVQWLVSGPQLADAAVLLALYWVARDGGLAELALAAAVVEAGAIMAAARWSPARPLRDWVGLTGLTVAAAGLGVTVRLRRALVASLHERAARLEFERDQEGRLGAATERARIAREMHDIVSHNLTVMISLADGAAYAMDASPEQALPAMQRVSSTGRQALVEMRRLLGVFRDDEPAEHPLEPQPSLERLDDLVARVNAAGIPVSIEIDGEPRELADGVQLAVFRVAQEALTNTLKHAGRPASAHLALRCATEQVELEVIDTGVNGGSRGVRGGAGGRGLRGMRERAVAYGGELEAGPMAQGGWRVHFSLSADTAKR
ncbi:MAG TPA: histidine kinase [Solirubrobacteraceae bacterium]|nr:histidine kinase [Solirubrobacteraceae bacterium]